jgi:hypothetical protein
LRFFLFIFSPSVFLSGAVDTRPPFSHDYPGMDDFRLTRSYLESLSTDELIKFADRYAIDIPPDLERVFIIDELLDADGDYDDAAEDDRFHVTANILEPVPLPRQYNITCLEVMLRDPLWAFVFWEIKGHDKEIYEKAPDFGGYYLKVRNLADRENTFTVSVGPGDTAWYLGFPPAWGRYEVELCARRDGGDVVLIVSAPFTLPKLIDPAKTEARDSLITLSGAKDFAVIRSADRLSRIKSRHSSQVE